MKPTPHQVIYTHGGGRLENQIIRFAHWIAWARAHPERVEVLDFAFWPFAPYFDVWREHPGCVFPIRGGREDWLAQRRAALPRIVRDWTEHRCRLQRVVQAAGHWRPGWQAVNLDIVREESLDLDDAAFLERVTRRPVTTVCGWKIASWSLVAEHESELRTYFQAAPEFAGRGRDFISNLRKRHDMLMGVLIRQSDYQEWYDGRFYFQSNRYATWMRELLDLHPGRSVGFVIASEVGQDPGSFAGLPYYFATGSVNSGGHWFDSWVQLSLCDFIVSPPSTFSATAAFVGRVPLWPVVESSQSMDFGQVIPDCLVGAARHPVFSCSVK